MLVVLLRISISLSVRGSSDGLQHAKHRLQINKSQLEHSPDRFEPILNHVLSDRHLEQKAEFASAGGIPCICRARCACGSKAVSLPDFGVFPITAPSLLAILLKWMGGYIKNTTPPSVKNS